jgi:hypothetical protein
MKRNEKYLLRGLAMEKLKISNTLVPWLTLSAPLFVVAVAFVASYSGGDKVYRPGINPWENFSSHVLVGWSLFVFPIYLSLQSALYAGIEHQTRAWAYLYSLPVPKWAIHVPKLIVLSVLIAISHMALFLLAEGAGWILGLVRPAYGFQYYSMHKILATASVSLFVAGLGMIALQWLISLYFESFLVPAALGLFATMAGAVSRGFVASDVSPYLWPTAFLNATLNMNEWRFSYVVVSLLFCVLTSTTGIWLLRRKVTG